MYFSLEWQISNSKIQIKNKPIVIFGGGVKLVESA